ncbi:dsRBD fold-containing protein [Microtetraspora fusca]|uniref:dsRBD fold-containing protein n=1 Tax=Microtetraspora fusca TaxID=1997 RepID=UPI000833E34A|nr:dsRBD fold-containing protein [Microtetraspora fusca]
MEAEQRGIQIYVDEDDDDTTARAVLSTGDDAHVVGVGRARRNPTDASVPEIGEEPAIARALADLTRKLSAIGPEDIAGHAADRGEGV